MAVAARGRFQTVIVCLAAAMLVAACSRSVDTSSGGTLEQARRSHKIRIGYANEAPYAYLDIATGKVTGEAPEIARIVLADLGITKVEGVLTEFGSLIPGLNAHRFDIIAAGMYVLPKRCKEVTFSNPTYSVGEAFVVAKGNPKGLHSYKDIARAANATLAVVAGTVERAYARDAGIPDKRVVVFPDAPGALEGVAAGRADAYAGTSLTVNYLLLKADNRQLERAKPFTDPTEGGKLARGYGAFGFRKSDKDLVTAFNKRLAKFIGTEQHRKLVSKFGFTSDELPGPVTAAELCRG